MAIKPVGINTVLATSTTSAQSSAISQQVENIRVLAESVGCYVAIGTNPTATNEDFYVGVSGGAEEIAIGFPAAQRVVGITTGTTTTIDFPEGTGSPFAVGEAVTLTAGQSNFDFTHKIVKSIDNTPGEVGFYNTRIVVDHNSSSVTDTFDPNNWTQLRKSIKVAVLSEAGTGKAYIQQVQVS
jgi:predicted metal-dependent TIM-barrel fold hydrolase